MSTVKGLSRKHAQTILIIFTLITQLGAQFGYISQGQAQTLNEIATDVFENEFSLKFNQSLDQFLEYKLNSTFYILAKGDTFIVDTAGSYNTLQNGSDGTLLAYNTSIANIHDIYMEEMPARGGSVRYMAMSDDVNRRMILNRTVNVRIYTESPATLTSGSYNGIAQLNNVMSQDYIWELRNTESTTIEGFYHYTGRTDNYGLLINGTEIYPEQVKILQNTFRKFWLGIDTDNIWASNMAGEISDNHISSTYDPTLGPGYCMRLEDANAWDMQRNVISGNSHKGDGILITDGDQARTPRVDLLSNQFVGFNRSAIHINTTGRVVGFNIIGGNWENVDATTGVAFLWIENMGSFGTINLIGMTYQDIRGNFIVQSDETVTPIDILIIGGYGQGETSAYGFNVSDNVNIKMIGGYGMNESTLDGNLLYSSNPSGKAFTTGHKYTGVEGMLTTTSVEARIQWTVPFDGYVKNARIRANAPAAEGNVTLEIGGAPTALFVTLTGGGGDAWYTDTTHYVQVSEGDLLSWNVFVTDSTTMYATELTYVSRWD